MIIGAISDLDVLGVQLEPVWGIIKKTKQPDLLLFAGDMYDYRAPENYEAILDFIKLKGWKCPIVAVFGNHEYDEDIEEIRKITKEKIIFLENESIVLDIKGKKVGIVGSQGISDSPIWMVFQGLVDIQSLANKEIEKIKNMLKELDTDVKILLTHYSPTYKTLKGEPKSLYSNLGTEKLEKILTETGTTFAVHGHAHYGTALAFVDSVPVFNVSFLINKDITLIDTEKLPNP